MAKHNQLGKWGEDLAEKFLHKEGYTIRERDWKDGHRDLDIIALTPDGITIAFIEVKTRTNAEIETPEQAVDIKKIRNLGIAANNYVKMYNIVHELRFDIISIVGTDDSNVKIEHIIDAFNPVLL